MAKKAYIGVDGVARKVKKMYLGAGGKARKVKKGYIGVSGVARPFFTGGNPEFYGTRTLPNASFHIASASIGTYAIFAGGRNDDYDYYDSVVCYNSSLTRKLATPLEKPNAEMKGASLADFSTGEIKRAVFVGGSQGTGTQLQVYSQTLTKQTLSNGIDSIRNASASVTYSGRIFFTHGYEGGTIVNNVSTYDEYLTKKEVDPLVNRVADLAGASAGGYALFAGGFIRGGRASKMVEAYESTYTKINVSELRDGVAELTGSSLGQYAIFAGGKDPNKANNYASSFSNQVVSYDRSLTQKFLSNLGVARQQLTSASVNDHVFFSTGFCYSGGPNMDISEYIDVYDINLTKVSTIKAKRGVRGAAGASVGDYVLFAGGQIDSGQEWDDVYVYTA